MAACSSVSRPGSFGSGLFFCVSLLGSFLWGFGFCGSFFFFFLGGVFHGLLCFWFLVSFIIMFMVYSFCCFYTLTIFDGV